MRLKIEMDVYSGRENPSWDLTEREASELQDRIFADPTLISDVYATDGRLGYRGYIVSALDEPVEDRPGNHRRMPSHFRIGGSGNPNAEIASFLIRSTEKADSEVSDFLREYASGEIYRIGAEVTPQALMPQTLGTGPVCGANALTSSTDFSFWNGSAYVLRNNCYAFASNYRSNTFPQPGLIVGHQPTQYTGDAYAAAVHADGWSDYCAGGTNLTAALVIWPGHDFHFYRLCAEWHWCHKPGRTPARNVDGSGKIITDPRNCDRGQYTIFVGFIHVGGTYVKVM